jgi:hypothetical protein
MHLLVLRRKDDQVAGAQDIMIDRGRSHTDYTLVGAVREPPLQGIPVLTPI